MDLRKRLESNCPLGIRDVLSWSSHDYHIVEEALKFYYKHLDKMEQLDMNEKGYPLGIDETKNIKSDKLHIQKLLEI